MYKYSRNTRQKRRHHVEKAANSRAHRAHNKIVSIESDHGYTVRTKTGRQSHHWDAGGNANDDHVKRYWQKRVKAWDPSLFIYIIDTANAFDLWPELCYRRHDIDMVPTQLLERYVLRASRDPSGPEMKNLKWLFRNHLEILTTALATIDSKWLRGFAP